MFAKKFRQVTKFLIILSLILAQFSVLGAASANAVGSSPELISTSTSGQPSNGESQQLSMSNDGRFVLFHSTATNLVLGSVGTTCFPGPVFVRDRTAGTTVTASVNSQGQQENGCLAAAIISGNGQYVFFTESDATNMGLPPSFVRAGQGYNYLFRHDLISGDTILASVADNGDPNFVNYPNTVSVSNDGNIVEYDGSMRNIAAQTNTSIPNAQITSVSGDGTKLTYVIPAGGSGIGNAIYVRDLVASQDTLVYEAPANYPPATSLISNNGRYVFFQPQDSSLPTQDTPSFCQNIGCYYRFDTQTGQTQLLKTTFAGQIIYPNIYNVSGDGQHAVVARAVAASGGGYQYVDMGSTGLLDLNIDTQASYLVGYGPDGIAPTGIATTYYDNRNVALTSDGSQVAFLSNSTNFGVPANCTVNTEGTITHQQCVDVYVGAIQAPPDVTPPTLLTPAWSKNPKATTDTTTLVVPATDSESGLSRAEYFIGDTDPGQGNGVAMTLASAQVGSGGAISSADLTTSFGTNLLPGVYKISVRAQDAVGNWSAPTSDYLVVYDPTGPKFVGKRTITPSLSNGDVLPGLIAGGQTDTAKFGFTVKYNNQGQIDNKSDLQFSYSTGTHCNNANKAQNCHNLSLNASQINWLTTQGTNNSTGIFQGAATLTVDGVTSQVVFRVTGVDGQRLNPTSSDQFQIKIFNLNDNPNTATPIYNVNSVNIDRGNIKITP